MPNASADAPTPKAGSTTTAAVTPETSSQLESDPDLTITRGSGNVFTDLGFPDAADRQLKVDLAMTINALIARRRLTQTAAAERLGVSQPKVSALAHYKLDGFSAERLMTFLAALGQDVEIVVKDRPRARGAGRVSVRAA